MEESYYKANSHRFYKSLRNNESKTLEQWVTLSGSFLDKPIEAVLKAVEDGKLVIDANRFHLHEWTSRCETVSAGAKLKFHLEVKKDSPMTEEILNLIFGFGEVSGLGNWRHAGYGVFTHQLKRVS